MSGFGATFAGAFRGAFRAEMQRIARTPVDLLLLTLMPLLLLGAMAAMIFEGSPHGLQVVVVDRDGGPLARRLVRNVGAMQSVAIVARTPDLGEALSMVRREEAVAVLVIPRGVGTRVAGNAPVEIFYEAAFLSTGALASSALRLAVAQTLASAGVAGEGLQDLHQLGDALPGVQVTILGNPTASLEWYLGLLLGPSVLHLLIAVTAVGSLGLLLRDRSFAAFAQAEPRLLASLAGRLAPHVLAGLVWGVLWLLWITLARGYRAEGSLFAVVLGLLLLFVATVSIALLLLVLTREVASALSGCVIIAGSALAYSGSSLPLTGAGWFPHMWSSLLPLTHYVALQMDQVLGASAAPLLRAGGALLLYPLIAGGLALLLIRRGRRA